MQKQTVPLRVVQRIPCPQINNLRESARFVGGIKARQVPASPLPVILSVSEESLKLKLDDTKGHDQQE
jgi:hypothetical protein